MKMNKINISCVALLLSLFTAPSSHASIHGSLKFIVEPNATSKTDELFATQPQVEAVDELGSRNKDFNDLIVFKLYSSSNCKGVFTYDGIIATNAVNGLALFHDFKISQAGTYYLSAEDFFGNKVCSIHPVVVDASR